MAAGFQGRRLARAVALFLLWSTCRAALLDDILPPGDDDGIPPAVVENHEGLEMSQMSCAAAYSTPCARTNSKWLAVKAANDLNARIADGSITKEGAWQVLTEGRYNMETGFYPFVLEKSTGIIVAHGLASSIIGMTLAQVVKMVGIAFFKVDQLQNSFVDAANSGGGWVEYFWGFNGTVFIKASYVVNITDDYMLAVGYHNEPLPRQLPCSSDYDSWCSIANVRSLVGKAQFLLSGVETLKQFEKACYQISFDEEAFQIPGGFYIFMYNYDETLVSHGRLRAQFGMTSGEIFVLKNLGTEEDGAHLSDQMRRTADLQDGGWLQYQWTNQMGETPFTKVAYVIKFQFQGESYYLGSGFTFDSLAHACVKRTQPFHENPQDHLPIRTLPSSGESQVHADNTTREASQATCTDKYNLPCASRVSLELSSHVMTHALSSPLGTEAMWSAISHDQRFKSNDFYVFVYDFNATMVAHGGQPELVGMKMEDIYVKAGIEADAALIHEQFCKVAKDGGGWVVYDWRVPGTTAQYATKISYMWNINVPPRRYYAGIGFFHKRAPIQEFADRGTRKDGVPIPCSSQFGLECSENNAKAIAGAAAAELTLVSSQVKARVIEQEVRFKTVDDVVTAINKKDPLFTVNDFFVSVFYVDGSRCPNGDGSTGCCLAHGNNSAYVNKTWQEILEMENITSIPPQVLHNNLGLVADGIAGHFSYSYSGSVGQVRTKRAIVAKVDSDEAPMYVVSEWFDSPQPPTCDSCPEDMKCTETTQAYCVKMKKSYFQTPVVGIVVVILVILLSLIFIFWYKHRNWKKRQVLAQKIKQMESQMKDMVEIVHDTGMSVMSADDYRERFGLAGVGVEKPLPPKVHVLWYWEESETYISRHHSSRVMPGANFVQYLEISSGQIERAYQRWMEGKGFKEFRLDLTGKIKKFDSQLSGSQYVVDFEAMTQKNIWSGYSRAIRRVQFVQPQLDLEVVNRLPPLPKDVDFFSKEGEDFLPTYPGQVIQVSKEHPSEEWLYGSVLYDPLLADAQTHPQGVAATDGLNRILAMALHDRPTSGWFPAVLSKPADVKVMQNLVESLGGEGVTNLKPPGRWRPNKEGCFEVESGSAEYEEVVRYFMGGLYEEREKVVVVGVERIQSMPLWQSYAVKKETMRTRDAKYPHHVVHNLSGNVERRWLFHGTSAEVIPKIVKQGFNRAFAGRNAVAYGKGVYFARDAAYSSHPSYSTPDSTGVQRMFLCRVAVGDWCRGINGQLTPDSKPRNPLELFDSTVDDETDPTIFVVYHDAQAYPDYLVSFRWRDADTEL